MAMWAETGGECPVPFPIDLGALSAPKLDSDAGVALGDPRGRKQYVSALSVFLIVFSVSSGLGALSAPKLDSDAGGVVWVGADVWEQDVSARFRFSPLFVELCVCFYLGALRAPKLDSDAGGGVG